MRHLLLIAALLVTPLAKGASFECAKANKPVEQLICSDKDLSGLDDTLSDLFSMETDSGEDISRFRTSQRAWLNARNSCADAICIKQQYERRIADLSCSPKSRMAGSAIGSNQCAYFTMRGIERELSQVEERYGRKVSEETNNPEYTRRTLLEERKAWRDYRSAQCALYGAMEGGSDGWKNAFSSMCELDETKKRLARLKKELNAK